MKIDKKVKILKVSEIMFNRFGISKTVIEEIAEEADVAKGTIYNYFGNKEGVIKALLEEKLASFSSLIEKHINSNREPIKIVKETLIEKIKLIKNSPFLNDILLSKKKKYKEILNDLDSRFNSFIERIINSKFSEKAQAIELDKEKTITTLSLFTKGIEEKLKNNFDSINIEKVEEYFDYLLKQIFNNNILNKANEGQAI